MPAVQPIAQGLGLHYLVALRTVGAEFDSAAYLYWLTFWTTLPLNVVWLYRAGTQKNLTGALRAVARGNLNNGHWNPSKYTLKGGYVRFFLFAFFFGALFVAQLVTAREPSYCKGCETTSVLGFVLISWLGTHALMFATYAACLYFVLWKSIRLNFGEENE